jgi:hypothetical protein
VSPIPDPNKPSGMPRPEPANPRSNPPPSPSHRVEDVQPAEPNDIPIEPDSASLPDTETDHPLRPHDTLHRG